MKSTSTQSTAKTSTVVNIEPKPATMQPNLSQSHQQQAQNTNMVNHGTPGNHAATANAPVPSSAPSHTTQSHPTASHGTPNSHSVTSHSTMGRAATPTSHAASPSHPTANLTMTPNHSPSIHVSLPSSTVHGITSHSGPCHTSVSHMTSTHVSVTPTSVTHTSSTTHPTMVHAPVGSHIAAAHVPGPHMANHHLTGNAVSGGLSVSSHVAVAPQQKATVGVPSPPVAAPPPTAVKGSAEDKVEVSAPPEAAMPYDKQGGESGQKPEAMTNGGAVTPQMTMLTASEPVRQISQKPVVKPNVLTHVIEGYIIQEGPEPFPVSRSSLVAETESPKPSVETNGKAGSDEIQHIAQVPPSEAEPLPSKVAASGSDRVELAKCEMCGKLGTKSKFKKSKRFCSSSCVKRYNLACSERLGIFAFTSEPENEDELPGKVTKKKKMGRKSLRKPPGNHFNEYSSEKWPPQQQQQQQLQQPKEDAPQPQSQPQPQLQSQPQPQQPQQPQQQQQQQAQNKDINMDTVEPAKEDASTPMETAANASVPEQQLLRPESSVDSPAPAPPVEMEVDAPEPTPALPIKNPRSWTVQEVADYIQELPGCTDYAEEFRSQEIDGQALLLLKEDHLMTAMNIKLGPALKICAKINALREDQ
uniref:Polyhomeotic-like protein 3 n=1 Tax=Rhipicephalus appendiculatus TaxID=34631 RepID=A0A131YKD4_RHIAP